MLESQTEGVTRLIRSLHLIPPPSDFHSQREIFRTNSLERVSVHTDHLHFNYPALIKQTPEEWKVEVINVIRCLNTEKEGVLPRDVAIHAMSFFGMNGEEHFHFSKKTITVKMFIDAVQNERDRNSDPTRRWKYIFSLIAGHGNEAITKEKLKAFFTLFGHTPEDKYCDDFIDEFDRIAIQKTEINLDDWLMFCRIHRLPF